MRPIAADQWAKEHTHLREMAFDEMVGLLLEGDAAVLLGEIGDANGIRRIQLVFEEFAAGVDYVQHLEHCGRDE